MLNTSIATVRANLVRSTLRLRKFAQMATPQPVLELELANHARLSGQLARLRMRLPQVAKAA